MRTLLTFLVAACFAASSSTAWASNWVKIPQLSKDGSVVSFDLETFKIEKGVSTFWERVEYADGSLARVHLSIDCNKRRWQPLYFISYDAKGNTQEQMSHSEPARDIPPDTLIDTARDAVCYIPTLQPYLPKRPVGQRRN